jgi:hypothetical protein
MTEVPDPVKPSRTIRRQRKNSGIALLIAIFVLLLVCVVGIAMMVASGTETSLTGNYQSSTSVYYAALAGLEEGRGRLLPKNPNYINVAVPGFLPSPPTPLPIGKVLYIENPTGATGTYPDTEYATEFSSAPSSITTTPSVSPIAGPPAIPGPLYKWVRINAITEQSINVDVNHDASYDSTTPLYYDGTHLNLTSTGYQALEITSLAVYPNGSQKILQYVTAPSILNLTFPAAVTLDGNDVQFTGPTSTSFNVNGNDSNGNPSLTPGGCTPGPTAAYGIGYTNNSDSSYPNIDSGNVVTNKTHYTGFGGTTPNIGAVALTPNLQTVSGLNALVQLITQNADEVITGPATLSDSTPILPSGMSSTNPVIVVVNGDLTIDAWHSTGYGILLVTGELTYDPDASWYGIILVIGKGLLYTHQGGTGTLNGAVFLATTVDSGGSPLPPTSPLGPAFFNFTSGAGGNGVYYSSCWVKFVQPPLSYAILSFREIQQ